MKPSTLHQTSDKAGSKKTKTASVVDYVTEALTKTNEQGVANSASTVADNCANAIGRLCEVLVRNGTLTKEDVIEIASLNPDS